VAIDCDVSAATWLVVKEYCDDPCPFCPVSVWVHSVRADVCDGISDCNGARAGSGWPVFRELAGILGDKLGCRLSGCAGCGPPRAADRRAFDARLAWHHMVGTPLIGCGAVAALCKSAARPNSEALFAARKRQRMAGAPPISPAMRPFGWQTLVARAWIVMVRADRFYPAERPKP
jgi:hypothetical protein